ncbi:MAG: alpha/beta fold hydrolase [Myxococcales bacterium]
MSGPAERTVVANQIRHHLLAWRGGDRATVLCLHGFLDSAWGFAPIGPALAAAGYEVVAPDLRGHGDSGKVGPGSSYQFYDYVFDVKALVDDLAPARLFLVGHSMGAAIAALYTGSHPERVERLALLEGLAMHEQPADQAPGYLAAWIDRVERARRRQPHVYPDLDAAAAAIARNDPLCPKDIARFLAEHGTREVPGGVAFKHDPLHLAPNPYPYRHEIIRPFWERIRCRTLLLHGEKTEMPEPEDMEARLRAFRTARRVTVAGAGHMMIRHQPEAVARELLALFEE